MAAGSQKVCYGIFLVIGVLYLIGSLFLPIGTSAAPQGGLFPLLVAILLVALSVALIAGVRKGVPGAVEAIEAFPMGQDRRRVLAVSSALVLYAILLKPVGYLVSTVALMGVIVYLLGLRGWIRIALTAVLTGVLSYYLFAVILDVPLPRGEVMP